MPLPPSSLLARRIQKKQRATAMAINATEPPMMPPRAAEESPDFDKMGWDPPVAVVEGAVVDISEVAIVVEKMHDDTSEQHGAARLSWQYVHFPAREPIPRGLINKYCVRIVLPQDRVQKRSRVGEKTSVPSFQWTIMYIDKSILSQMHRPLILEQNKKHDALQNNTKPHKTVLTVGERRQWRAGEYKIKKGGKNH